MQSTELSAWDMASTTQMFLPWDLSITGGALGVGSIQSWESGPLASDPSSATVPDVTSGKCGPLSELSSLTLFWPQKIERWP